MEEGGLNDIAPEVLHGCLIFRRDAITAEDLESGMTPVGKHGDQLSGNSPLGQEHLEDLMPENRLQLFQVQRRSDPELVGSLGGLVEAWFSADVVPVSGLAKGGILFGDIRGKLTYQPGSGK